MNRHASRGRKTDPRQNDQGKSYPTRIRTWTNSTKNCGAAITLSGSVHLEMPRNDAPVNLRSMRPGRFHEIDPGSDQINVPVAVRTHRTDSGSSVGRGTIAPHRAGLELDLPSAAMGRPLTAPQTRGQTPGRPSRSARINSGRV